MHHTSGSLRAICDHLEITISALADSVEIQRSALSKILNGKEPMTEKMLGKLLDYEAINDDDAAALAEDWTIDHWPRRARDLLVIRRRPTGEERLIFQETPPSQGDNNLERTISDLRTKARGNPALARALRNLNRTLDGHVDVID
ncbi:hypothetical protein [Prosthecobacter sp.]|uniref:hypothetical protein n=1 Tax=Prosthecobacter sp. TaxID=1965333 RepID=UPI0037838DE2